jgi:DNA-binding GntR family transcriptional regulator
MDVKVESKAGSNGRRLASSERCYQQLKWMLMAAQIPEGSRLGEVEWAKRLKTHRSAVREALTLLSHEGALRRGERGGFFTPLFEERDITEIFEARAVLEIGAMRLIHSRRLTEEDLRPLEEICDTMERLLESDMWFGFVEADRRFHEKLVDLAGNRHLKAMYGRAILPHRLPRSSDHEEMRRNFQVTLDDHREIHGLLSEGMLTEAITRMEKHLEMSGKFVPVF